MRSEWLWAAAIAAPPVWGWLMHRLVAAVWPPSGQPPAAPGPTSPAPHDFQI